MTVLFFVWQLPQHIAAAILHAILRKKILTVRSIREDGCLFGIENWPYGIALGRYIFLDVKQAFWPWGLQMSSSVLHEYGHCLQSKMLGPLYLIVVGIPSMTMNLLTRAKILKVETYYKRWPESWAEKLGKTPLGSKGE